jgi:AcrR family transcriptional regulator
LAKPGKIDSRQRILDTAAQLFYREGVRGVGVDRIAAESGVAKMTLYHHFRSKDELVEAWLQRRDQEWMNWLEDAVDRRGSRLITVFDALREWFEKPDFRGCAFINAHAELGSSNAAAAEIVTAHKRSFVEYLASLARLEGAAAPESLARELLLLVEGAIVTASIQGDARVADDARSAGAKVIAAHGLSSEAEPASVRTAATR